MNPLIPEAPQAERVVVGGVVRCGSSHMAHGVVEPRYIYSQRFRRILAAALTVADRDPNRLAQISALAGEPIDELQKLADINIGGQFDSTGFWTEQVIDAYERRHFMGELTDAYDAIVNGDPIDEVMQALLADS